MRPRFPRLFGGSDNVRKVSHPCKVSAYLSVLVAVARQYQDSIALRTGARVEPVAAVAAALCILGYHGAADRTDWRRAPSPHCRGNRSNAAPLHSAPCNGRCARCWRAFLTTGALQNPRLPNRPHSRWRLYLAATLGARRDGRRRQRMPVRWRVRGFVSDSSGNPAYATGKSARALHGHCYGTMRPLAF